MHLIKHRKSKSWSRFSPITSIALGQIVAALMLAVLAAGCATTSRVETSVTGKQVQSPPPGIVILVLDPKISAFDTKTEAVDSGGVFDTLEFARQTRSKAVDYFTGQGGQIITPSELGDRVPDAVRLAGTLSASADQFFRAFKAPEVLEALMMLAARQENFAVLVQWHEVKTGPAGSWNPNTGQITSAMNGTLLRAVLIKAATREVLWRNEVHLHDLPRIKSAQFEKALNLMFPNQKVILP